MATRTPESNLRGTDQTTSIARTSPLLYARVAGFLYLVIFVAAIFANFFVLSNLVVPGDATATASNIAASEGLFRVGIVSFIIMLVADAGVAWALYVLFKPVNRNLSLLATVLRLMYTTIHGIALLNLVFVLEILNGDYLATLGANQLDALVLFFVDGHNYGWLIGLVFFGAHLFVLGYLVFKSGYFPRTLGIVLGVLLMVASASYIADTFANILLPNYAEYAALFLLVVAVPSVIAEMSFALWLLIKGVDVEQWETRALESPKM